MIYYVDATNGSDSSGDGTRLKPYSTLDGLIANVTFSETNTIILKDGTYNLSYTICNKISANSVVTIKGSGYNTLVKFTGTAKTWYGIGEQTAHIIFCKLKLSNDGMTLVTKWEGTSSRADGNYYSCIIPKVKFSFYNIVFVNFLVPTLYTTNSSNTGPGTAAIRSRLCQFSNKFNDLYFQNCTVPLHIKWMIQAGYSYEVKVINSYGYFTSSMWDSSRQPETPQTTQLMWDYENNVITSSPNVNSIYRINDESVNESELGVYFNYFNWDYSNYMLLKNGLYYSILDDNYNIETKMYNIVTIDDITSNGFSAYTETELLKLFTDITINNETFKPIDKFDNFSILCNSNNYIYTKGLKSTAQLIVESGSNFTGFYEIINSLVTNGTISDTINDTIKIIISTDDGVTWKTWDGTIWIDTDIIIPLKSYSELSEEELNQWNTAITDILSSGISLEIFNLLNFNFENSTKLRLAFVLSRTAYDNIVELTDEIISYDLKGCYKELTDDEFELDLYQNSIKVTSNINANKILINTVL